MARVGRLEPIRARVSLARLAGAREAVSS